jgi:hypothetical protein
LEVAKPEFFRALVTCITSEATTVKKGNDQHGGS